MSFVDNTKYGYKYTRKTTRLLSGNNNGLFNLIKQFVKKNRNAKTRKYKRKKNKKYARKHARKYTRKYIKMTRSYGGTIDTQ